MTRRRAAPSRVRISGGRWKGRLLDVPEGARPTSSRAREALFDLLGERIPGARVLDLFAGSGAVGFEAVSRGAARAVLVDRESEGLLRARQALGAGDLVAVRAAQARSAVRDLARAGERFDLVFADPPYGDTARAVALSGIAALLSPGGMLVLQADAQDPPPAVPGLQAVSRRAYGRNVFHFFRIL